jgi:hypothetical protein
MDIDGASALAMTGVKRANATIVYEAIFICVYLYKCGGAFEVLCFQSLEHDKANKRGSFF